MTADDYLKKLDIYHKIFEDKEPEDCEYTESDIILFAEAYLKQKVSEITDEDIKKQAAENHFGDYIPEHHYNSDGMDYEIIGAKWFKEKLLNSK